MFREVLTYSKTKLVKKSTEISLLIQRKHPSNQIWLASSQEFPIWACIPSQAPMFVERETPLENGCRPVPA